MKLRNKSYRSKIKIHFIQQDSWVKPGEYLAWAERHGYEVSFTKCWLYEAVPEVVDADMLVVLGGHQSPATTKMECGYFDAEAEKALIRNCVDSGIMVIGVCLGAQLVSEALGATYSHSPEREIGPVREIGSFLCFFPRYLPCRGMAQ